jgi:hypothetical protein
LTVCGCRAAPGCRSAASPLPKASDRVIDAAVAQRGCLRAMELERMRTCRMTHASEDLIAQGLDDDDRELASFAVKRARQHAAPGPAKASGPQPWQAKKVVVVSEDTALVQAREPMPLAPKATLAIDEKRFSRWMAAYPRLRPPFTPRKRGALAQASAGVPRCDMR